MSDKKGPGRPAKVTEDAVMNATRELRAQGREVTIPAVRELIGTEGSNTTIGDLIKICLERLRAEEASMRKLSPEQEALALQLMRQAVGKLCAEIEGEASRSVEAAKVREEAAVSHAQMSEKAAWREVDEKLRERDEARERISELDRIAQDAGAKLARAEGRVEQQGSEIQRLASALDRAQASERDAITSAAQLRGQLEAKAERENQLTVQLEEARTALSQLKGGAS